ncbi:hypothetical protein P389DRAFT_105200 [Cystobasidium minutum MCA 4210]|uniref:uncharacterized protein n=1 Tax=Cystobasidium minutum MCA 4210 TaxID=1397322 RepID=UPI0034CD3E5D|eukprot:jgi/Rhomi1/105200/CE105199_500
MKIRQPELRNVLTKAPIDRQRPLYFKCRAYDRVSDDPEQDKLQLPSGVVLLADFQAIQDASLNLTRSRTDPVLSSSANGPPHLPRRAHTLPESANGNIVIVKVILPDGNNADCKDYLRTITPALGSAGPDWEHTIPRCKVFAACNVKGDFRIPKGRSDDGFSTLESLNYVISVKELREAILEVCGVHTSDKPIFFRCTLGDHLPGMTARTNSQVTPSLTLLTNFRLR